MEIKTTMILEVNDLKEAITEYVNKKGFACNEINFDFVGSTFFEGTVKFRGAVVSVSDNKKEGV